MQQAKHSLLEDKRWKTCHSTKDCMPTCMAPIKDEKVNIQKQKNRTSEAAQSP